MDKRTLDYQGGHRHRVTDHDAMDYITAQLGRDECGPSDEEASSVMLRQLAAARDRLVADLPDYSPAEDIGAMFRKNGQFAAAAVFDRLTMTNLRLCARLARRYRAAGGHPFNALPDLLNSATIGLMRGLARYEPRQDSSLANFVCWSINNAMDEWMGSRRVQSLVDRKWKGSGEGKIDLGQDRSDTFANVLCQEEARIVRWAIGRFLTENEQRVIELRFYEGLVLKDAGAALAMSHQGARQAQLRALAKLRRSLKERLSIEECGDAA